MEGDFAVNDVSHHVALGACAWCQDRVRPERQGQNGDVEGGEALRSAETNSRDQELLIPDALP